MSGTMASSRKNTGLMEIGKELFASIDAARPQMSHGVRHLPDADRNGTSFKAIHPRDLLQATMDSRQLSRKDCSIDECECDVQTEAEVRIIDLERKTGRVALCFCWNGGRDTLLEIGVEQFVGFSSGE